MQWRDLFQLTKFRVWTLSLALNGFEIIDQNRGLRPWRKGKNSWIMDGSIQIILKQLEKNFLIIFYIVPKAFYLSLSRSWCK